MAEDIKNEQLEPAAASAEPQDAATDDLLALVEQRANTYILLSRLYLKEIDRPLLDELHGMLYPMATGNDDVDAGYRLIATFLSNLWTESLTELAVDYVRCFLGNSVDSFGAAYPYESVYTSEKRLLMQEARDEVLAIYRSYGIEKRDDWGEGEDHIALELEFMRHLCDLCAKALKAGDEAQATRLFVSQRDFLQYHLVSWAPMMTADLKRFAKTKLYQGLAYLTDGFLRTDYALLKDLLSDQADQGDKSDQTGQGNPADQADSADQAAPADQGEE